jgi:hypothetical protein
LRIAAILLLTSLVAAAAPAARAESPFASVPAGSEVRLDAGLPLRGVLMNAGPESLLVRPARGPVVALPNDAVKSIAWKSGSRPSARKDVLLGIGIGAAGGAVIGAAVGGMGEGGGGSQTGGGGGDNAPRIANAVTSTAAAATVAQATTSATYRAVLGAVIGGIAGGLAGGVIRAGLHEDVWTTVPGPVSRALGVPATPTTALFAIRLPLPFGHRTR